MRSPSLIVLLALFTKINSIHQTCHEFMDHLQGKWEGGGIFILQVKPEFGDPELDPDNNLLVPNDFGPADLESFDTPANRGRFYMHEEIDYWGIDDRNVFAGTGFKGTGYAKLVKRALLMDAT